MDAMAAMDDSRRRDAPAAWRRAWRRFVALRAAGGPREQDLARSRDAHDVERRERAWDRDAWAGEG